MNWLGWIASIDRQSLQITDRHAARTQHGAIANRDAWPDEGVGRDPGAIADMERADHKLEQQVVNVVRAGTDMCALTDHSARTDSDPPLIVQSGPGTDDGAGSDRKVRGQPDDRRPVKANTRRDIRTEQPEDKAAPAVEGRRRPRCQHRPSNREQGAGDTITDRKGCAARTRIRAYVERRTAATDDIR